MPKDLRLLFLFLKVNIFIRIHITYNTNITENANITYKANIAYNSHNVHNMVTSLATCCTCNSSITYNTKITC